MSPQAPRRELLADVGVAVVALVLLLQPALHNPDCDCDSYPWWGYALAIGSALPLVWRRRFPFVTSGLTGAFSLAVGLSSLPDPPVQAAGLVGLYTAAAYASRRLSVTAGAIATTAIGVAVLLDSSADAQDVLVNYLLFSSAWLLGDSARGRRERADRLEERAAQLERARAAEAAAAVTAERNRIARELHDVVAHHVSLMVVQAEAGPVVVDRDPARAAAAFDSISATGKAALTEMRRLLGVLRSDDGPAAPLAPQPGLDRVGELLERARGAGLDVRLEVVGDVRPLPPAVELSAYRLVQEALTNAVRHAGPTRAVVRVAYAPAALGLEVTDAGPGREVPAPRGGAGLGLVAMRERVAVVGGTLVAGPRDGGGWAVRAELPLADVRGAT
ncbi:sensor histidine kinase [Motilibacter aurantiacus]|uniref:sensor histidine kinase n=1 Tax=Motilibacter aurantiacus TaxID=2714955 RepID=UPI001407E813|nr:sensor histidine kinase [Motilibacter aurantiacus]